MLHTESIEINGTAYWHTYTDDPEHKRLLQTDTGIHYDDAMDLQAGFSHAYTEVDKPAKVVNHTR